MKTLTCLAPASCLPPITVQARWWFCGIVALTLLAASAPFAPAQPANDNFADAEVISGSSGSVLGSTVGGTKETGEPNHGGNVGGNSVWYRWEAPASGMVEFELLGSDFDTTVGAYRGASVNALTPLASNDDPFAFMNTPGGFSFSPFYTQSRIEFPITNGVTYWIAVDGWSLPMGGLFSSGDVVLRWQVGPPPHNDNFNQAQVMEGNNGHLVARNAGTTKETGEPNHAGNSGGASVWFSWTPSVSGMARIRTFYSVSSVFANMDTLLGVYTGGSVDALTTVASSDNFEGSVHSQVTFAATAGTTYRIAVDGKNLVTNVVHGEILLVWGVGLPAGNNAFANATVLTGSRGSILGNTFDATKEVGEPRHSANVGGASVWFNWTAPADGQAVFSTTGSPEFDTLLAVYTGNSPNSLTEIASNDQIDLPGLDRVFRRSFNHSQLEFTASAGTTYRIAVDGWNAGGPGASADSSVYRLSWAQSAPPNDEFFSAQLLAGSSGRVETGNFLASKDPGEPAHVGAPGQRSIWYEWTMPTAGVATIDLTGSTTDTQVAVYTGDTVDALTPVAENDDSDFDTLESRVRFRAEAGTTYKIAVDSGRVANIPDVGLVDYILDGWMMINYSVAPPPILEITPDGSNVNISWSGPYRLESTTALNPPDTVWIPVAETSPVTLPSSGGPMFFRAVFP